MKLGFLSRRAKQPYLRARTGFVAQPALAGYFTSALNQRRENTDPSAAAAVHPLATTDRVANAFLIPCTASAAELRLAIVAARCG